MNANTNKVIEKIRALLAKANGTDNEHEADAFLTKAQELMEEHQIDLHHLSIDDPIGVTFGLEGQQGPPKYKTDVQCALASYYGARTVLVGRGWKKWQVEIIGPESSRLTTEIMTPFVWAQVTRMAKAMVAGAPHFYNHSMAVRQISKALCVRIYKLVQARATKPVAEGTSFSLVVVDNVDRFIKARFPNLKESKERTVSLKRSAVELAERISLNEQVTTRDTKRLN